MIRDTCQLPPHHHQYQYQYQYQLIFTKREEMAAVDNSYIDIHLESIQEENHSCNNNNNTNNNNSSSCSSFSTPPLPTARRVVIPKVPCKRIGNYLIGKTIGSGTSSKVKIGTHVITGKRVAVKITKPKRVKERKEIEREISILKLLKHNHIIQLFEAIYEEDRGRICLVLEYISGGELFDYIVARGRLSEKEARKFFRQILSGLIYCHENMVCHRDLKLENILVDDEGNIKISDFGYSNIIRPGCLMSTFCGSPVYAPPEILLEKKYNGNEVDIWSIGVILYSMVTGQLPWSLTDGVQVEGLDRLLKGEFKYPSNVLLTNEVKELINRMIVANPAQRIKLSEIKNHSWVNKGYDMTPDDEYNAKNQKNNSYSNPLSECVDENMPILIDAAQNRYVKVSKNSSLYASTPNLMPNLPSPRGASISVNSAPCGSPMLSGSSSPTLTTPPLSPIAMNSSTSNSTISSPSSTSSKISLFHGLFKKKQLTRLSSSNNGADADQQCNNCPSCNSSTSATTCQSSTSANTTPGGPSSPKGSSGSSGASSPTFNSSYNNLEFNNSPSSPSSSSSSSSSSSASSGNGGCCHHQQQQQQQQQQQHKQQRRFSLEDIFKAIKGKSKSKTEKLRKIKGPFTHGTTTSLSPADIIIQIENLLQSLGIKYQTNGFVFECKNEDQNDIVILEIEICRVSGMDLFGLKFRRTCGQLNSYSSVCKLVIESLQL
ncbi:putative protein serine/threonine kinase [Cavenderia fasciculata]|uniref:non-specific serine/threonine protein kinase n=1 Tax=Cavenderia fasciculata TaxID=261658 RepID=F4PNK7_CACFS|nr:putative protein serine/threonine kinase [Cavenderia fasciculata]EGG23060.1 putative protein serine/threonine kinase [Cavenderia fasciculata]|eukprot:XP_004360911.1 putative protein serine/threonine kinase [Cavenderia fasciculata]